MGAMTRTMLIATGSLLILSGLCWGKRIAWHGSNVLIGKYVEPTAVSLTIMRDNPEGFWDGKTLAFQIGWTEREGFNFFWDKWRR